MKPRAIKLGVSDICTVMRVARTSRPAQRGDAAMRTRHGTVKAEPLVVEGLLASPKFAGIFVADAEPGASASVQIFGVFIP